MTLRENLLKTLRREGYSSVPLELSLSPFQIEKFRKKYNTDDYLSFFNVPVRGVWIGFKKTSKNSKLLFKNEELPEDTFIDEWGVGYSSGSKEAMHMKRMHHPLKGDINIDDVKNYPYPVIDNDSLFSVKKECEELKQKGLSPMGILNCSVWETAWYIRGMEDLMVDMLNNDLKAKILLENVTKISEKRAYFYALAGVDILHLGDDIGTQNSIMMSVDLWKEWIKERLHRIIISAKRVNQDILIYYHSDGYIIPFIEDLIETGIDILNPIQPECMDFYEVVKLTKGRLSYWGTIGTQTTLPFGTPEDVKKVIYENVKLCGDEGGLVIAPTHLVEPEVPFENILALKEGVEECSKK